MKRILLYAATMLWKRFINPKNGAPHHCGTPFVIYWIAVGLLCNAPILLGLAHVALVATLGGCLTCVVQFLCLVGSGFLQ